MTPSKQKLESMPYANAYIVESANTVTLVSYTTPVCSIVKINGFRWLACNGLYSQTTRKHIAAFCRQYGTSYYLAKMCHCENVMYCLDTGEIRELHP